MPFLTCQVGLRMVRIRPSAVTRGWPLVPAPRWIEEEDSVPMPHSSKSTAAVKCTTDSGRVVTDSTTKCPPAPERRRCLVRIAGSKVGGGTVHGFLSSCGGGSVCEIPFAFETESVARRACVLALNRMGSRLHFELIPLELTVVGCLRLGSNGCLHDEGNRELGG